jgi:hypothetical protein
MPVIIGLLGLLAAAYFWTMRARNAAQMTHELADVASDVMAAARRLGFRRRTNLHPVESVDDAKLAIGALGVAFLELGGLPSTEEQDALMRALQSHLGDDAKQAEETLILGRWLVNESGGPQQAITRIGRRLAKIDRAGGLAPLMAVLNEVGLAARTGLHDRQKDALAELARAFRVG